MSDVTFVGWLLVAMVCPVAVWYADYVIGYDSGFSDGREGRVRR